MGNGPGWARSIHIHDPDVSKREYPDSPTGRSQGIFAPSRIRPAMARPIHQLRNLGPRCGEMLAAIGITDSDQLRRIGAAGDYCALIMAGIARPHRMLLYALGGALADVDCLRLPAELKQDLEDEAGVARREPR
jgi:hypothetical protein